VFLVQATASFLLVSAFDLVVYYLSYVVVRFRREILAISRNGITSAMYRSRGK